MENRTSHHLPPFQGQVILVTGAGQGLGRAVALACAARGATVVLLGRTIRKLEQVYDEIVAQGSPMPAIFPMDLGAAEDRDFETLAHTLGSQLGRLDGIVHCAAGFELPAPLGLQDLGRWQALFRVNAAAPAAINRACEPLLRAAPSASVILVGESHGHEPAAYWGGFAVSKAALEAYFRILAAEWSEAPTPRAHLFIPGPIASPQRAQSHPGEDRSTLPSPQAAAEALVELMTLDARGVLLDWQAEARALG